MWLTFFVYIAGMKRFITIFLSLLFAAASFAQEMTESDYTLAGKAVEYQEEGKPDKALEIYYRLAQKYPDKLSIRYEIAYCLYQKQEYKQVHKTLSELEKSSGGMAEIYALHGNCLRDMGRRRAALKKYKEGLRKFPDSGHLHHELGKALDERRDHDGAADEFAEGIAAEPYFASNYYQLSQLLCQQGEPLLGILYGEIYRLLLPDSEKSRELSRYMYGVYKDMGCQDIAGMAAERWDISHFMIASYPYKDQLVPLLHFHQSVKAYGHWDAYNMWLFRYGDEDGFDSWYISDSAPMDAFLTWYNERPFDPAAKQ